MELWISHSVIIIYELSPCLALKGTAQNHQDSLRFSSLYSHYGNLIWEISHVSPRGEKTSRYQKQTWSISGLDTICVCLSAACPSLQRCVCSWQMLVCVCRPDFRSHCIIIITGASNTDTNALPSTNSPFDTRHLCFTTKRHQIWHQSLSSSTSNPISSDSIM